jgi:hypothetical protein
MSSIKPIPVYSTVCNLEFKAIHSCLRRYFRDNFCHNLRYDINDAVDLIVSDTMFVSVSNYINAELQDYEFIRKTTPN